jgi:hypothetical protein
LEVDTIDECLKTTITIPTGISSDEEQDEIGNARWNEMRIEVLARRRSKTKERWC